MIVASNLFLECHKLDWHQYGHKDPLIALGHKIHAIYWKNLKQFMLYCGLLSILQTLGEGRRILTEDSDTSRQSPFELTKLL